MLEKLFVRTWNKYYNFVSDSSTYLLIKIFHAGKIDQIFSLFSANKMVK